MSSTPPKVYPSVDWLTMTVSPGSRASDTYDQAKALLLEQVTRGDDLKTWGANGFRGWSAPHIRTGRRNAETVVELSGPLADKHWRSFYPFATNVSRLDTCVTVTFPSETNRLAYMGYHAERVSPRKGFPAIGKTLMETSDGGQTLYLGSPKSARMARLYDKTAESKGEWPAWSWRWELQERRDMGGARARLLDSADDLHRAITAGVHGFFTYHGVSPWFKSDGPTVFAPARRTRTDMSRRLDYYRRSIAPGVRRGIDRGHGALILAALGLDGDELRQLLMPAAGAPDPIGRRAGDLYKEVSSCPPRKALEDLTPPRNSPAVPSPRAEVPNNSEVISSASGAPAWPTTSRTGST